MEKRESNYELLRIILMIMVLILHYLAGSIGGALNFTEKGTINYYIIHYIESLCIIAVNVFIIITGYFMVSKNSIKISKVVKLINIIVFYGVIIFFLSLMIGKAKIDFNGLNQFLKTITDSWFITIYCILYLLIPFINKLINSISKKNYKILFAILIFFFSIWPSVWSKITVSDAGYGIINFFILYLIGAYIKLYLKDIYVRDKAIVVFILSTFIVTICSLVADRAWHYNFIFNMIGAVALFLIFKDIKIKHNRVINKLAGYTFAVYIIHTNPFIMQSLYRELFKTPQYYNSNFLILHMIGTVLIIYISCIVIETIRRLLLEKIVDKQIEKINVEIKCD